MLVSMGRPGAVLKVRLIVAAVFLTALAPIVNAQGLQGAGMALVGAALATALGMFWNLSRVKRPKDPSRGAQ